MKVCLIIPPSGFLLDERVFPSLGILKVGAALRSAGHEVRLVDLSGNTTDTVAASFEDDEVYGITATTPQFPAAVEILEVIWDRAPEARTILGGPHVTLTLAARKAEQARGVVGRAHQAAEKLEGLADVLVAGDGEKAVLDAVEGSPPKILDGDDPKGPYWLTNQDLTASAWPARDLIDLASYHYEVEGHNATSLIGQLGCPFGCGFCGGRSAKSLRQIRTRTTQSVLAELYHLHQSYGYTGFMFYDDEMNVSKEMVPLMEAIGALPFDLRLRGFIKAELFTDDQARAMYRAGFRWILTGFEAAHPRILKNIEKRATIEDNTRCVEIAKRHGLKVKALMSVGHPGESPDTVLAVQDWLVQMQVDDFDVTIITPYPGSPYYDKADPHDGHYIYTAKGGDRLHSEEVDYAKTADYYKGRPGSYKSYVWTDAMPAEGLVEARDTIEREVRSRLGIAYPTTQHEHTMGQS